MSYASECMARGRSMFADTLQGVREREGRRWFLVLPTAIAGSVGMLIVGFFPWGLVDAEDGSIIAFIFWYSLVVFVVVPAPKLKRVIALLATLFAIVLAYFYIPWDDANSWVQVENQRVRDPDAYKPGFLWLGALAGCVTGLTLVLFRLRTRWVLLFPAIILGFDVSFVFGMMLFFWLAYIIGNWFWLIPSVCGLVGGTALAAWIAPDYKRQAVGGAFLLPLVLIAYRFLLDWL